MKTTKKLLCSCLVLLLVILTLCVGMTASATNTKSDAKAFSSIKIDGKKVKDFEEWPEVEVKTKKPTVKVKVAKGWKLKKIICENGSKKTKIKNGGKFKVSSSDDSYLDTYLVITATKGKKTAKVEISVYY